MCSQIEKDAASANVNIDFAIKSLYEDIRTFALEHNSCPVYVFHGSSGVRHMFKFVCQW